MNIAETAAIVNALNSGGGSAGGGYDLVIKINSDNLSLAVEGELINGDFEAIETKAMAEEPIQAVIFGIRGDDPNMPYTKTFGQVYCYYDNYGYDPSEHCVIVGCMDFYVNNRYFRIRDIFFYRDGTVALSPKLYYQTLTESQV